MRIEFEKKNFSGKLKKKFFSGKFEKKIFSENCEKFLVDFRKGGGGGQLLCKFGYQGICERRVYNHNDNTNFDKCDRK